MAKGRKRRIDTRIRENNRFSFFMSDSGDMSVGIWPGYLKVDIESNYNIHEALDLNGHNNREILRSHLENTFAPLFSDTNMYCGFEDECECGHVFKTSKDGRQYLLKHKCDVGYE